MKSRNTNQNFLKIKKLLLQHIDALNTSRLFFGLFLIFFPFQIRGLVYTGQLFLSGNFNIYSSFFVYLADIFLLLAVLFWGISIWQNKKKAVFTFGDAKLTLLLMLFLLFALIPIINVENKFLHLLLVLRFLELFLLYLMIVNQVLSAKIIIYILVAGMAFQALLAVFQYLLQGAAGLNILGEAGITTQTPGAAKIDLESQKVLRAWGTFPHSNVLGGALFFTLILGFAGFVKHRWFYWPVAALLVFGLIFTFSRSAFLALVTAFLIYFAFRNHKISFKKILLALTLLLLFIVIFKLERPIFERFLFKDIFSMQERGWYFSASKEMFLSMPFGAGLGGFTEKAQQFLDIKLLPWQYQPVHNIFLLSFNEIGIIGGTLFLTIFIYLFYHFVKKSKESEVMVVPPGGTLCLISASLRSTEQNFIHHIMLALLVGIIVLGLFDHYLFSIYSGQVLLFIYFGLAGSLLKINRLPARNS